MKKKTTAITVLMTLWGKRYRKDVCVTPEESREWRLNYISALLQRRVTSAKELNPRELRRVIDYLRAEEKSRTGRSAIKASTQCSREQLFLIRQLEQSLGWASVPERLAGFLATKFHGVRRAEHLTRWNASKAIEALFRVWARNEIKSSKGADYRVGAAELEGAVTVLKRRLQQPMERTA